MNDMRNLKLSAAVCLAAILAGPPAQAGQTQAGQTAEAADLKRLSIEELMQIDVTSVSRRAEPFSRVAAAISVITGEEHPSLGRQQPP